jgi:hypothetical protein
MAVTAAALRNVAQSMAIVADPPTQAGAPFQVRLSPALTDLTISEVITGTLSLDFVFKQVRFLDDGPEPVLPPPAARVLGPMPMVMPTPVAVPVGGLVDIYPPTAPTTGVPGAVGSVVGSLPLAATTSIAPTLTITWDVLDENGVVLAAGSGYLAPNGVHSPELSVVIAPPLVALGSTVSTVKRTLRATITLTVQTATGPITSNDPVSGAPVTLTLDLMVPALAIPTLCALFLDRTFEGAVLVVVPKDSPLKGIAEAQSLLNEIESVGSSLRSLAGFLNLFLGVQALSRALSAQPHVQFRAQASIDDLNDITLIQRAWYENDTEAENELSSLIFLGIDGKSEVLECFNNRDCKLIQGAFSVTAKGGHVVLVENLHVAAPVSDPAGAVTVLQPPTSVNPNVRVTTFGDELSSLRWKPAPIG